VSQPSLGAPADEQFFVRLATLNDRFAAEVPALFERLAMARAAFDAAAPDLALAEEMRASLHTMAGSAATFGFRVLGQRARALEQRLRVLMAFDAVLAPDWETWFCELDGFVAWGRRDPKAAC
jgi:HPt (histidine-containing phosphotransfer) domain-containing protein